MNNYFGETKIESTVGTPFENFGPIEWALEFIAHYGGIDGAHHKDWVLDQVARILKGTPVELCLAKWADGEEHYSVSTQENLRLLMLRG